MQVHRSADIGVPPNYAFKPRVLKTHVVYESLKIFIILGKIVGYLHWCVTPGGSSRNVAHKILSVLYQIIFVGVPWAGCHTSVYYFFALKSSTDEAEKIDDIITSSVLIITLSMVDCMLVYCIVFGYKQANMMKHWLILDDILCKRMPKRQFQIAQAGVILCIVIYTCTVMPSTLVEEAKRSVFKDNFFFHASFLVTVVYYYIYTPILIYYTSCFFLFACWMLSVAYQEIQDNLKQAVLKAVVNSGTVISQIRKRERKVYFMFNETQKAFEFNLAIITVQTSILVCFQCFSFMFTSQYAKLIAVFSLFLPVLCITIAAENLSNEQVKLLQTICDIDVEENEISQQKQAELERFKWKLSNCRVQFTSYGFFILNKSLVTAIVSGILTYIVVLSQFRLSAKIVDNSKNYTNITNGT